MSMGSRRYVLYRFFLNDSTPSDHFTSITEKDLDTTLLAHEAFTASIKASPTFSPPFTSLGIYYRALAEPDLPKASQCFQKAFELNAKEELAARYLAEEYAAISEWNLVEVVARRVVDGNKGKLAMGTKAAIRFSWAWKAIGGADLVRISNSFNFLLYFANFLFLIISY